MATTAAAKADAAAAAPPKKNNLVLIVIIAVVLLAGAGGAAWFFMKKNAADQDDEPKPSNKPAVFVPIEQFTVNLQPEDGPQFLQTALTLKVVDQQTQDAIKANMPEIRSRILLLLSTKKPSQIISRDGKRTLADEIIAEVEAVIAPPKPKPKPKAAKKTAKKTKGASEADEDPKAKKSKAKAKEEVEDEEPEPRGLVLDVLFTHFIIQ